MGVVYPRSDEGRDEHELAEERAERDKKKLGKKLYHEEYGAVPDEVLGRSPEPLRDASGIVTVLVMDAVDTFLTVL